MTSSLPEEIDVVKAAGSSALLTRDQGATLRALILSMLESREALTIDMSGVKALTPSFADEFFGGLDSALGAEFSRRVRVRCAQPAWKRLIQVAIGHRRTGH